MTVTEPDTGQGLKPRDYQTDLEPMWCPGCGDFGVLAAATRALAGMGLERDKVAVITGIGCSGRFGSYTDTYGFHGVHGRALAVGTGLKLARPDLTVLVTGGDGDGFAIGGNHLLHAGRRNVDLTYMVMDNQVYGQTKGQASPTTEADWEGSGLTPRGPGAMPIQPLQLALTAGANFIARAFSGRPRELTDILVEAVLHPGFSFIDVLSPCVTYRPEQSDWKKMVRTGFEDTATTPREAALLLLDDDGFNLGILYKGDRPPMQGPPAAVMDATGLRGEFAL